MFIGILIGLKGKVVYFELVVNGVDYVVEDIIKIWKILL